MIPESLYYFRPIPESNPPGNINAEGCKNGAHTMVYGSGCEGSSYGTQN